MNITFAVMGKLKEGYFREACEEYRKRISAFANVKIIEPDPAFLPQDPGHAEISRALAKEAEKLNSVTKGYKIALCVEGKTLSSGELAKKLADISQQSADISFIVGSSYGLDEEFKRGCDFRLSMSPMTFPHSLARVMLFEQVYRALSINANMKYHK